MHNPPLSPTHLLRWYLEAGVDETVGDEPVNRLDSPPPPVFAVAEPAQAAYQSAPAPRPPASAPKAASAAIAEARAIAERCTTLDELREAVKKFDGIGIKKTAMNTVFADGNPNASVMIIGEAPGAQEDRQGIPFCGPSGALLDKMFAAIGLSRQEHLYISNTVFWRPPGNRAPNTEELAICEPFVQKHVALIAPKILVFAGGVASTAMLKREQSVSRLRGKFYDYENPFLAKPLPCMVFFHPAYLLRSPAQKRLAWSDLLKIKAWLEGNE